MKRFTMVLAGLLSLGVLAACGPGATAPTTMEVVLTGENEVPPVVTDSFGTANVTVAGTAMAVDGSFDGFEATMAHVHGPAGVGANAGVLFTLDVDNANTHFEGTFTMTPEQIEWFEDGLLYLNVHSEANSGGEIRGQIEP